MLAPSFSLSPLAPVALALSLQARDTDIRMVHPIKKLTFYASHADTGTGVLRATDRHATGTDMGAASAIMFDRSQSRMVVLVWQGTSERQ